MAAAAFILVETALEPEVNTGLPSAGRVRRADDISANELLSMIVADGSGRRLVA